jgi:hypothetical protein
VSYRAFSDDARPAAEADARLRVIPRITLRIRPEHTRNGRTITYSGRVEGGYIPAGGLALNVQYLDIDRWRTFDETVARARDGRFVYRYTFRRTTRPVTYTFRVALPPTGVSGYPYQPGASPPRSVRVDG